MTNLQPKTDREFEVRCIWCGVTIRRDNSEDSQGVCLRCFYRILSERFRAQRHARSAEGTSDR